jgi:phosphonate transport system substrate-binding protein
MDIFFDSPLIGMKVASQTELNPFLLSWKEGHRDYHTVFIVPVDSDISFDNLYNKTIIFEDRRSTSGYLLPLIHLKESGYEINLESSNDLSFVFSLDDENTPIWILEGRGDIGATSNLDFESIPTNIKEKLKVIESTEVIPRQIVFVNKNLEFQNELKEILLKMNENPETQEILAKISKTSQFSEIDTEKDLNQIKDLLELIQ